MRAFKTRSNVERRRRAHTLLATAVIVILAVVVVLVQLISSSTGDAQQQQQQDRTENLQRMTQELLLSNSQVDKESAAAGTAAAQRTRNFSSSVATTAKPCTRQSIQDLRQRKLLQSQSQEDEHLLQWFNGLCGGTYLEMGALDGIQFSNSYVFHKALDWKGLLIELAPQNFRKLQKNRPDDTLVHAAVCSPRQTVHYYQHPHKSLKALSGVYEFTSESFRKQYWSGLKNGLEGTKEIQCIPLQDIIDEKIVSKQNDDDNSVTLIDFFSLDVEGGEIAVLQSIDWDKTVFGMILVEADEHNLIKNLALRTFVERQGYTFLGEFQRSYWFVHREFDQIYRHVLHAEGTSTSGATDTT